MRPFSVALLAIFFAGCAPTAPVMRPTPPPNASRAAPDDALEAAVRAATARFPTARIAVSVRDRETGAALDLHGDTLLHAASTMKVPVLVELFRQAHAGTLDLDDSLAVENRFRSIVDGSEYAIEDDSDDSLRAFLGQRMTVRALAERMITVSSNLATNLLIARAGADRVQAGVRAMGATRMHVRRGVEDGKAYAAGLNNTATSHDLAEILDRLAHGEAVSPPADAAMRAILLRQRFNSMIPAGLPPGTPVAHKTGWITRHAHDAAIIAPEGPEPYVLVVLTRGFATQPEADAAVAEVARAVHAVLRGGR